MVINGDTEGLDSNLQSWEIVSVDSKLIEIDMLFARPLQVSQGEVRD